MTAVFTPFPKAALQQLRVEDAASKEYAQEISRLRSGHRIGVRLRS